VTTGRSILGLVEFPHLFGALPDGHITTIIIITTTTTTAAVK